MKSSVLILEDDKLLNRFMVEQLSRMGFAPHGVQTWAAAEAYLQSHEVKLIVTDVQLPDANALDLLPRLCADQPVIMLTAYASVRDAVQAMKSGAAEYLVKPINMEELELMVTRTLDTAALRQDYQFCKRSLEARNDAAMIGGSRALLEVGNLIEAVAPTDMTVLIQGESGVGKELVARSIHLNSPRAERNFVAVDCCTLQEKLFESELFGHERGAFTGAVKQKKGLIEGAEGGTLFLDEIGEVEFSVQAKLLRVLETGRFRRVGGTRDLQANVRVVAATNRDLEEMARAEAFRQDLFYRLAGLILDVPPLRQRREDIPDLVRHFIRNHDFSRRINKTVTAEAMRRLTAYDWPGNIRELKNVIERAIILSRERREISVDYLAFGKSQSPSSGGLTLSFDHEPTLEEIEREYLRMVMEKHAGHRSSAARTLGISERSVYRLIGRYGLKQ
ncbi:MAG: sigma-54 dependent transcriptional regulator [Gammaproteobacteria bacterium]|nr:sigma-54 dependent transcriptional regulator [Gammaproteobacteria bacterium]